METAVVISQLIQLVTLANEATAAAARISALIAKHQATGTDISAEDWNALLADRQIAQAVLLASIKKREASEG